MWRYSKSGKAAFTLTVCDDGRVFIAFGRIVAPTCYPSIEAARERLVACSRFSPGAAYMLMALDAHMLAIAKGVPPVSYDGDTAHRNGCQFDDNPFPAGGAEHLEWANDWKFRHLNSDGASDGPGGPLRPDSP